MEGKKNLSWEVYENISGSIYHIRTFFKSQHYSIYTLHSNMQEKTDM